jgi:hypothetical protein
VGRPPKLTAEVTDLIASSLSRGIPVRWACGLAGIHHSTYYAWVARGEEWLDHKPVPKAEQPYVKFSDTMRRARAEGLARPAFLLHELMNAKGIDPAVQLRALIFYLTHADREHWHPVQHAADIAEDVKVVLEWSD